MLVQDLCAASCISLRAVTFKGSTFFKCVVPLGGKPRSDLCHQSVRHAQAAFFLDPIDPLQLALAPEAPGLVSRNEADQITAAHCNEGSTRW